MKTKLEFSQTVITATLLDSTGKDSSIWEWSDSQIDSCQKTNGRLRPNNIKRSKG